VKLKLDIHYNIITAEKCGIQLDHPNQGMFVLDWEWRLSGGKVKMFLEFEANSL